LVIPDWDIEGGGPGLPAVRAGTGLVLFFWDASAGAALVCVWSEAREFVSAFFDAWLGAELVSKGPGGIVGEFVSGFADAWTVVELVSFSPGFWLVTEFVVFVFETCPALTVGALVELVPFSPAC